MCVVLASGGYPGKYETGKPITGLDKLPGMGIMAFHAGTKLSGGELLTSGGRVLGVTAVAEDMPSAIARAYEGVREVAFEAAHYRTDIGKK